MALPFTIRLSWSVRSVNYILPTFALSDSPPLVVVFFLEAKVWI
jgi:hypothetical protein